MKTRSDSSQNESERVELSPGLRWPEGLCYYPGKKKARFFRYRCAYTYMRKCERQKVEFLRPKKSNWFGRKEYKAFTKGKILGLTAANGAQLFVRYPSPWNSGAFAKLVRKRVGPFFQRAFPHRRSFRILLDSEPLLHTDEATAAISEFGITAMSGWPK